jgi:hypothetical protein
MLRDTIDETAEVESTPTWAPNSRFQSEPLPRSSPAPHRRSPSTAARSSAEDHPGSEVHPKRMIAPVAELSAHVVVREKRVPETTKLNNRRTCKLEPETANLDEQPPRKPEPEIAKLVRDATRRPCSTPGLDAAVPKPMASSAAPAPCTRKPNTTASVAIIDAHDLGVTNPTGTTATPAPFMPAPNETASVAGIDADVGVTNPTGTTANSASGEPAANTAATIPGRAQMPSAMLSAASLGAHGSASGRLDAAILRTEAKAALVGLGWKPPIAGVAIVPAIAG